MAKTFSSPTSLIDAISKDHSVEKQLDLEFRKDKVGRYDEQELRKYSDELISSILQNLSRYYDSYSPILHERTYQLNDMFSNAIIDSNTGNIEIPFSSSAYQRNAIKSDVHYSFVPVLLNYGWSAGASSSTPRARSLFEHYEGSQFITNAINNFNKKYAGQGISAKFIVGGQDVEMSSYSPYI